MIWQTLIQPVTGLIGKVLDKVAADKMSEAEKEQLKLQANHLVSEELQRNEDHFREFVVKYEGAAKDMPKFIQVLRGSVRPVLTYLLIGFWLWGYGYLFLKVDITQERVELMKEIMALLFKLNIISLGFWYGERLLTRTGLMKLFKK